MGKSSRILVTLTDEQREIVRSLVGPLGGSESDVIKSILLAWLSLSDKSLLAEVIKKRWLARK